VKPGYSVYTQKSVSLSPSLSSTPRYHLHCRPSSCHAFNDIVADLRFLLSMTSSVLATYTALGAGAAAARAQELHQQVRTLDFLHEIYLPLLSIDCALIPTTSDARCLCSAFFAFRSLCFAFPSSFSASPSPFFAFHLLCFLLCVAFFALCISPVLESCSCGSDVRLLRFARQVPRRVVLQAHGAVGGAHLGLGQAGAPGQLQGPGLRGGADRPAASLLPSSPQPHTYAMQAAVRKKIGV